MELSILWTDFAKKELRKIFEYHREKASLKVAKKIVLGISLETKLLKNLPKIGQKEELLSFKKEEFRYLVYKNYKIIYCLNESKNKVEIVDVFDTRQSPQKIERGK